MRVLLKHPWFWWSIRWGLLAFLPVGFLLRWLPLYWMGRRADDSDPKDSEPEENSREDAAPSDR